MLLPNENPFQQGGLGGYGGGGADPMMMLLRLFSGLFQRSMAPGGAPPGAPPGSATAGLGQQGNSTVIAPIYNQAAGGAPGGGGGSGAPSAPPPTTPTAPPNPNWWNGLGIGGGL